MLRDVHLPLAQLPLLSSSFYFLGERSWHFFISHYLYRLVYLLPDWPKSFCLISGHLKHYQCSIQIHTYWSISFQDCMSSYTAALPKPWSLQKSEHVHHWPQGCDQWIILSDFKFRSKGWWSLVPFIAKGYSKSAQSLTQSDVSLFL